MNFSAVTFLIINEILFDWLRCVTPLRALLIIVLLLENNMWGLGCFKAHLQETSNAQSQL